MSSRGRGAIWGGVVAMITLVSGAVSAADFRAFTPVEDVCPTCPKRATDTVVMNNGTQIKALVVAENDDYLILSRYGEVRVLPKSRLSSVEWANDALRTGLTTQDQIVLSSGHVITGSILEENADTGLYRVQSSLNAQTYVVFKDQIEAVYKAGSRAS